MADSTGSPQRGRKSSRRERARSPRRELQKMVLTGKALRRARSPKKRKKKKRHPKKKSNDSDAMGVLVLPEPKPLAATEPESKTSGAVKAKVKEAGTGSEVKQGIDAEQAEARVDHIVGATPSKANVPETTGTTDNIADKKKEDDTKQAHSSVASSTNVTSKETKALRTEEEHDNNVMVDEINPQASAERVPNDESEAVGADMLREKLLKNESRAENSKSYERLPGPRRPSQADSDSCCAACSIQ